MASKDLHQLDWIPGPRRPEEVDVVPMLPEIRKQPTLLRAIVLAQRVSGLEDKEIYDALNIDGGQWSRIQVGKAHFPADKRFVNYMNVVHNDVVAAWVAEARGYDWSTIRRHRSNLEMRVEQLERDVAERDRFIDRFIVSGGRK